MPNPPAFLLNYLIEDRLKVSIPVELTSRASIRYKFRAVSPTMQEVTPFREKVDRLMDGGSSIDHGSPRDLNREIVAVYD